MKKKKLLKLHIVVKTFYPKPNLNLNFNSIQYTFTSLSVSPYNRSFHVSNEQQKPIHYKIIRLVKRINHRENKKKIKRNCDTKKFIFIQCGNIITCKIVVLSIKFLTETKEKRKKKNHIDVVEENFRRYQESRGSNGYKEDKCLD